MGSLQLSPGGEDDFADMPPLEDSSDHDRSSPRKGLCTPTSDTVRVLEPSDEQGVLMCPNPRGTLEDFAAYFLCVSSSL